MSMVFDLKLPRRDFVLHLEGAFDTGTVGIYGPSGAGKTSLFSLLTGLEKPEKGSISLNGKILTDTDRKIHVQPHKRRIGMVFQEKLLFPHLDVKHNILFGERYNKVNKVSFDAIVDLLDLSALLDSMPGNISGGEQQRAAVGRALMTSPELLLLDEPFNAVDSSLRSSILPYLKKLRKEWDIPMLVISHDLPDIQRLTDTIYLVDKGQCAGFGSIIDLIRHNHLKDISQDFVNTFHLYDPLKIEDGLYICRVKGCPDMLIKTASAPEKEFTLIIHPGEISLSVKPVKNISIQNQISGIIESIIEQDFRIYCIINTGIRIASEITPAALKDLKLAEGKKVTVLFKTHSLSF